jgi:hypothetical protein
MKGFGKSQSFEFMGQSNSNNHLTPIFASNEGYGVFGSDGFRLGNGCPVYRVPEL